MGIFDVFKGKKEQTSNVVENKQQMVVSNARENKPDIGYTNSKGTRVEVRFGDVKEIQGKLLQTVFVDYTNPGEEDYCKLLGGKEYLMEPGNISIDDKGVLVSNAKENYKNIEQNDFSKLKGFFDPTSVAGMETNYIGDIGKDNNGNLNNTRYKDESFLAKYKEELSNEKANKLKVELKENTYETNEVKPVNIKTCHAQNLSGKSFEDRS